MKKYILSPCGTSLLTNQADQNERGLVFKYANKKKKEEIAKNDRNKLEKLIKKVSDSLKTANNEKASKMSAELNGIIKIYNGEITNNNDSHLLLSTDTWLGEETAKLVKNWLESKSESKSKRMDVSIHRQSDLQTADISAFQLSLSELIKKFSDELPSFSQTGYKIIFNLTGGFKSVQGFLQSIANFYADETVYIFETSSQLLRIPKLPIRMDAKSVIKERITVFRQLSLGVQLPSELLEGIPETLLFKMEGEVILSPWGALVWEQSKQEIYGEKLLPSPIDKIKYTSQFEKSISALSPDRLTLVNKRIDQLAQYFLTRRNPRSLDFKQIKGNVRGPSSYEIDAWSDKDAKRIFGHYEDDVFILDRIDKGLH
jgi:putative CRISPR-associated protein (TIGR02619 family)